MAGQASAFLLLCLLFSVLVHALPAPPPSSPSTTTSTSTSTSTLADFAILEPKPDTLWVSESLPSVSWDKSVLPERATLDIALLSHERKESTLLRRYVPAHTGSTMVNLKPDLKPGTYSLLITVYKDRSSTILARSLVQNVLIVPDDSDDEMLESSSSSSPASESSLVDDMEEKEEAEVDPSANTATSSSSSSPSLTSTGSEQLSLNYQPARSVVLRAPYTLGWSIPAPLKKVKNIKVDIHLVDDKTTTTKDSVVAVLATRMNARTRFMYVVLPDTVPRGRYRIKIEMYGKGRRFIGYTAMFNVRESGMSPRHLKA